MLLLHASLLPNNVTGSIQVKALKVLDPAIGFSKDQSNLLQLHP
jgi:hypothetical protein